MIRKDTLEVFCSYNPLTRLFEYLQDLFNLARMNLPQLHYEHPYDIQQEQEIELRRSSENTIESIIVYRVEPVDYPRKLKQIKYFEI